MLTGLGEKPRQEDIEYLEARLPTTATLAKRITLKGRESTISALLRNESRTVQQVAEDTLESQEDISAAASSLAVEGLVKINGIDSTLREEVESFLAIAKICIDSPIEFRVHELQIFCKGFGPSAYSFHPIEIPCVLFRRGGRDGFKVVVLVASMLQMGNKWGRCNLSKYRRTHSGTGSKKPKSWEDSEKT